MLRSISKTVIAIHAINITLIRLTGYLNLI
jgi:hypothetical protein